MEGQIIVGTKSTAPIQLSISTYFAIILLHHVQYAAMYHAELATMGTTLMFSKYWIIMLIVNFAVKPFLDAQFVKIKEVVVNVIYHTLIIMVNVLLNLETLSVGLILSALEDLLLQKLLWIASFSSFSLL